MVRKTEVLGAIAGALELETIGDDDSHLTIETWDSLGQLSIQTKLSELTGGASEDLQGIALAFSVKRILGLLEDAGLLE